MKRLLLICILSYFAVTANSQSFSVDDLIKLSYLPAKNINTYLSKKGFAFSGSTTDSGIVRAGFRERIKGNRFNTDFKRSVDICIQDHLKNVTLHTPELSDFLQGEQHLIKSGFIYDTLKNIKTDSAVLFQKANISVWAKRQLQEDSTTRYTFELRQRSIPESLTYADDLLQFDSHEFLAGFFGKQNVKKDLYYLSEKEFKKCSVLFSGTTRQAVFVWDDEINLNNLLYVMVTNSPPTEGAKNNDPLSQDNEWHLKNGIYPGMPLRELLKINESDFDIYGNKSEFSYLIKPGGSGKIDFSKTAVMLSCHECFENKIFNRQLVSALDLARANLEVKVFDIVIYASR